MLHLLRHLPALDVAGRAIGRHDVELEQPDDARRLADAWNQPRPTRVISSPLKRAIDTAAPLADRFGLSLDVDPRLQEVDFGAWEGMTWEAIEERDGDRFQSWMQNWETVAPPGGESFVDVVARMSAFLDDLPPKESTLVVAHAGAIRAALVTLLDLKQSNAFRLSVAHGALTSARLKPPELVRLNQSLI